MRKCPQRNRKVGSGVVSKEQKGTREKKRRKERKVAKKGKKNPRAYVAGGAWRQTDHATTHAG
jgi:hypothetical protein